MFILRGFRVFYDNGEGGGGGGSTTPPPAGADGNGSGNGSDNAGNGNGDHSNSGGNGNGQGSGSTTPPKNPVTFSAEQQEVFNREVRKAEQRGKDAAKREAEQKSQEEQGQFKPLYESLKTRIETELEPKVALVGRLSDRLNASIDAEIASWPASLKEQDPGKDDVEARDAWVSRSRNLAKDLLNLKQAPNGEHGQGSDGKPTDSQVVAGLLADRYVIPGATGVKK